MLQSTRLTVKEWQKRLSDTFTVNGLIGGSLLTVHDAEDAVSGYVINTFRGQNVLWDSFQSFFIDTLTLANDQIVAAGWPKSVPNYPVMLGMYFNLFRRFRSSEILYLKGYPLDGYSLMRDIKDRALMLCGVAQNIATFSDLIGKASAPASDVKEFRKQTRLHRKDAEHRVTNWMMGKTSGLSNQDMENLKLWDDFFHEEVHGGKISLMRDIQAIQKGELLEVGPAGDRDTFIVYINRCSELGWMAVRLLPYLQRGENSFGEEWERKRTILDESFRHMAQEFSDLGKDLGPTFIRMIDTKFVFKQPFYYFEADGSAA